MAVGLPTYCLDEPNLSSRWKHQLFWFYLRSQNFKLYQKLASFSNDKFVTICYYFASLQFLLSLYLKLDFHSLDFTHGSQNLRLRQVFGRYLFSLRTLQLTPIWVNSLQIPQFHCSGVESWCSICFSNFCWRQARCAILTFRGEGG